MRSRLTCESMLQNSFQRHIMGNHEETASTCMTWRDIVLEAVLFAGDPVLPNCGTDYHEGDDTDHNVHTSLLGYPQSKCQAGNVHSRSHYWAIVTWPYLAMTFHNSLVILEFNTRALMLSNHVCKPPPFSTCRCPPKSYKCMFIDRGRILNKTYEQMYMSKTTIHTNAHTQTHAHTHDI